MTETTPLARIEADDDTITGWLHGYAAEHGYDNGQCPPGDPDHDDECACADDLHFNQFGGYESGEDTLNEAKDVACALADQVGGRLVLTPIHAGGVADGFMVEAHVENGFYLSKYVDWKHITDDRQAKGIAAALGYAHALIGEFNLIVAFAVEKGLASETALPLPTATCGSGHPVQHADGEWHHTESVEDNPCDDEPPSIEARAMHVKVGDVIREDGMDDWLHVVRRDDHGDRILVVSAGGTETSFDMDETVEVIR